MRLCMTVFHTTLLSRRWAEVVEVTYTGLLWDQTYAFFLW